MQKSSSTSWACKAARRSRCPKAQAPQEEEDEVETWHKGMPDESVARLPREGLELEEQWQESEELNIDEARRYRAVAATLT